MWRFSLAVVCLGPNHTDRVLRNTRDMQAVAIALQSNTRATDLDISCECSAKSRRARAEDFFPHFGRLTRACVRNSQQGQRSRDAGRRRRAQELSEHNVPQRVGLRFRLGRVWSAAGVHATAQNRLET